MARKQAKSTVAKVRREATIAQAKAVKAKADAECAAYTQMVASYKGGVPTRASEAWPTASTVNYGTSRERHDIGSMRDRAYNAYDNNPVAQTLIDTECDHVIGDGLNYQPTTDSEEWNREAEDKYYQWLESCTVRGPDIITGCEIESELWKLSRIAGDVGWILVKRDTQDRIDSRIQLVPAENIVTPSSMLADKSIWDGIKFDESGAPIAFYYLNETELNPSLRSIPISARDFVYFPHLAKPKHARGTTSFRTIFEKLSRLDRYEEGVALAAWMATVFGILFKQNNSAKQFAALPALTNASGVSQKAITIEDGGLVKYLGTDEDVAQVQASQPMQQTPEFIRTMLRSLGMPFGMPLEVIAKDMSTCNFASARIGLLPFYRSCRKKATRFGYRWSRTIRWWLSRELHRTDADPKKWKTKFPENYWAHDLLPNAFEYTDPVSDAQSDHLQRDMGTKSTAMIIAERGRNAQKIRREIEAEEKENPDRLRSSMTRDAAMEAGADPNAPNPELERIKAEADAYGVSVRAGAVTPQTDDENQFRTKLKLPPMSKDATKAWEKDEGTRRPITLAPPPGTEPTAPFGRSAQPIKDNGDTNGDE